MMKTLAKGVLCMIGGILCLIIGFAGIFLPVIPGIPLMLLGLHLLGVRMPFLSRWMQAMRAWLTGTRTAPIKDNK